MRLEGNVYFPPDDVRQEYLVKTRSWSLCPWKGLARYYSVRVGGQENKNAAWYCGGYRRRVPPVSRPRPVSSRYAAPDVDALTD